MMIAWISSGMREISADIERGRMGGQRREEGMEGGG
jgi:hypothetical protein